MDILLEKRTLIDAIDCKISQLEDIKAKLVNEHNEELMRRQQAVKESELRAQMPNIVMEEVDDVKSSKEAESK